MTHRLSKLFGLTSFVGLSRMPDRRQQTALDSLHSGRTHLMRDLKPNGTAFRSSSLTSE